MTGVLTKYLGKVFSVGSRDYVVPPNTRTSWKMAEQTGVRQSMALTPDLLEQLKEQFPTVSENTRLKF